MPATFPIRLLAAFALLPLFASAQREPLSADLPFFQKKMLVYQRWLDTTGLGKVLKTDLVKLKDGDDTQLQLLLLLNTRHPDTAASMWAQAKRDFEAVAGRPLLPELFSVFLEKMEVPAAQGDVQIYFKGKDGRYSDCFYVAVWSEGGKLKTEETPDDCRAQPITLRVLPVRVSQKVKGETIQNLRPRTAEQVQDTICRLAHKLYPPNKYPDNSDCAGRYPVVTCGFDALGNYRVVISDLCKEVLTESTLSTWCAVARKVGWDKTCSDIRRERIEFTFGYVPDGEAFKITGTLSGKFGSGIYRPRGDTGWKDMTPDFGSWEKIFADKFLNILAERLRR